MNLYRSFGNTLEAWVTVGAPRGARDEWLGHEDRNSLTNAGSNLPVESGLGMNLRSESEDSGVELVSLDTAGGEADSPALKTQPPVFEVPSTACSSSSPRTHHEESQAVHLKLEQALRRTDSRCRSLRIESPDDRVVPRKPRSGSVRCGLYPSGPNRRPAPLYPDTLLTQSNIEQGAEAEVQILSPGFSYLEQMCRLLEEIARLQTCNQGLQMEVEALRENNTRKELEVNVPKCKGATQDLHSSPSLETEGFHEHAAGETEWSGSGATTEFRRRSASDTRILSWHLTKVKSEMRRGHVSEDHLLDCAEESKDHKEVKKRAKMKTRSWKFKFSSFKEASPNQSDESPNNSQLMHSSEKNRSGRRRLSMLFRGKRKTAHT